MSLEPFYTLLFERDSRSADGDLENFKTMRDSQSEAALRKHDRDVLVTVLECFYCCVNDVHLHLENQQGDTTGIRVLLQKCDATLQAFLFY